MGLACCPEISGKVPICNAVLRPWGLLHSVTSFPGTVRDATYNHPMSRSPHLLIVDDDAEIRDLLARFLKKHGYRVDTAADGRAMMKQLEAGRFDLVVLDLMLPGA